ncbi:MAG: polysaccharide deacetylase family protein [Rhodospirillales bacterium]
MITNPVPWPNGAKCACCLTFDMDADSLIHVTHPADGHKRVSALSMLKYGPEVGVPRIAQTYRDLETRQTFFIPAWPIERYPAAVEAILEGGHEIAHHGYIHENPNELSDANEAHCLDRGIEVIEHATGKRPRGFRAPHAGFETFRREFEVAYACGGLWVPVLHPFATGRLARWTVVREFLELGIERGDFWFAPMEAIADHVARITEDGEYSPRVDHLPYYDAPITVKNTEQSP